MNKYKIVLNEDCCPLKIHVVSTILVEKSENSKKNFNLKVYQSGLREIMLITDKVIEEKTYLREYSNKTLKWKVSKEEYVEEFNSEGEVVLESFLSWGFVEWGGKKEISPIDHKTGKIIHPDKLNSFLEKNTGLIDISILSIQPMLKLVLNEKTTIYNRFKIEFKGRVSNKEQFCFIKSNNIGKRKTYGFGAVLVKK